MKTWNLIVGMDLTECGERAFRMALQLARGKTDATIHIAHAVSEGEVYSGTRVAQQSEALQAAPTEVWDRVARVLQSEDFAVDAMPIWQHVRIGDPTEVIAQVATDYDGDLVIVGTHGRKGMKRLVMGSVAESLVRDGRFPVLVAHENLIPQMEKTVFPDQPLSADEIAARKISGGPGAERHVYRSTLIDAWRGLGRPTSATF